MLHHFRLRGIEGKIITEEELELQLEEERSRRGALVNVNHIEDTTGEESVSMPASCTVQTD